MRDYRIHKRKIALCTLYFCIDKHWICDNIKSCKFFVHVIFVKFFAITVDIYYTSIQLTFVKSVTAKKWFMDKYTRKLYTEYFRHNSFEEKHVTP